jgi:hypothetical protein
MCEVTVKHTKRNCAVKLISAKCNRECSVATVLTQGELKDRRTNQNWCHAWSSRRPTFGLTLDSGEERKQNGEEKKRGQQKKRRMRGRLWWIMICGLFNDAVTSVDYFTSNGKMINERWIENDVLRNGIGLLQNMILGFVGRDWGSTRQI